MALIRCSNRQITLATCIGSYLAPAASDYNNFSCCFVCKTAQRPSKRKSQPDLSLPSIVLSVVPQVYVAEWDCVADADNELSFQKGEQLHVISHQYEQLGWLLAQRTGSGAGGRRFGLVPKNYVVKAIQDS